MELKIQGIHNFSKKKVDVPYTPFECLPPGARGAYVHGRLALVVNPLKGVVV